MSGYDVAMEDWQRMESDFKLRAHFGLSRPSVRLVTQPPDGRVDIDSLPAPLRRPAREAQRCAGDERSAALNELLLLVEEWVV